MNTGNSIEIPALFTYRNRKLQIRYNIQSVEVPEENGTTATRYNYDYVEVPPPVTRKAVIDAIVRNRYDVNDEFALVSLPPTDPEYITYRKHVDQAKAIADEVLSVL